LGIFVEQLVASQEISPTTQNGMVRVCLVVVVVVVVVLVVPLRAEGGGEPMAYTSLPIIGLAKNIEAHFHHLSEELFLFFFFTTLGGGGGGGGGTTAASNLPCFFERAFSAIDR